MATTTKNPTPVSRSRRKTVPFGELRALVERRGRSSYPQTVQTERLYWIGQIKAILGDDLT